MAISPPEPRTRPVGDDGHGRGDGGRGRPLSTEAVAWPEPPAARPMAAGHVIVVGLVSFLLAALFNSQTLLAQAEKLPLGSVQRSVAVWNARRVDQVSHALFFDRPSQWVADARGRHRVGDKDTAVVAGGPRAPAAPGPHAGPTTTAKPATGLPLRKPTADAPLRVWVGGDSMAQVFGSSLVRMANKTGVMKANLDYKLGTGLTRTDAFDWPAHLQDVVDTQNPEVMVVVFGGNDAQKLQIGGKIVDVDSPLWQDEYRRRVSQVMNIMASGGRPVIWIGQPVMRSPDYGRRMNLLNTIYKSEAANHPGITFFDTTQTFAGPDGKYSAYLADDSGKQQLMRDRDGIHLLAPGGDRLAKPVLAKLQSL